MSIANTDKTMAVCKASSSISTIIGGVSSFITNFYISKFPKGFFKKVYISESLNSNNLKNSSLYPQQMKPYLAVQPQFELGNIYMELLPLWHTANYYILKNKYRNYRMVFNDPDKGIRIYSIPNRIKLSFGTLIKLETEMKAYDVVSYLNQNFEEGGYNYLNGIRLPSEVPKLFMLNICKVLNLDFYDPNDREELRRYLLKHSLNSINEIINLSTGNPSFMYNYTTNLLVNYPDLASHDKTVKNLIVKETAVRFNIGCELWIPGTFILEIENRNDLIYEINEEENLKDDKFKFNLVFDADTIPETIDNKTFIMKRSFLTDVNTEVDELDLKPILKGELLTVLEAIRKYNKDYYNDITKFIEFKLYLNNKPVFDPDYEIDYSKFILKTKNPQSNRTYTIYVYGDLEILNKVSDLINAKNYNSIGKLFLQN